MEYTNRRIEAENLKAEGVIFEKRVFDLAKQAVAALQGETIIDHNNCCFFFLKPTSIKLGRLAGQIATRCRQRCVLWLVFENSRVSKKEDFECSPRPRNNVGVSSSHSVLSYILHTH